jgi:cytosine/adenosine deaminase-related metal-dependent hydrolase
MDVPASGVDTLLLGGRCIDPETGLDDVCAVAITGGVVQYLIKASDAEGMAAITSIQPRNGSVDCANLVVCPGFIDLHSHGAGHVHSAELQAMDGCTFHGELEFGVCDVKSWFAERETSGQVINYACSSGHIPNRIHVMAEAEAAAKAAARANAEAVQGSLDTKLHDSHSPTPHLLSTCFCTSHTTHHTPANGDQVRDMTERMAAGARNGAIGYGLG